MRNSLVALAAALALAAIAWQPAQAYSLVGTWRGSVMVNGAVMVSSLVLEGNGRFNELDRAGSLMSEQTGTWQIVGGLLHLTVLDWQPKEQCLPTTGCLPIRQPPGSLYRVQWLSANVIRCQDVNFGGSITYYRG